MLYAVLLDDVELFAELAVKHGKARREYLASLARLDRLVLEGSLGERGALMILQAESLSEVVSVLQGDPYVTEQISSSVQIRSLEINLVGDIDLLVRRSVDGTGQYLEAANESEEICACKGK
ncbi:MAG: YciI family protein [Candidatus Binatus sp.]|uniref:YciI family protein n=1 Tax=Candidatus Binatus sp. TaxID=2811406 RepID=UPI003BB09A0F